jgi:hypothetical protein
VIGRFEAPLSGPHGKFGKLYAQVTTSTPIGQAATISDFSFRISGMANKNVKFAIENPNRLTIACWYRGGAESHILITCKPRRFC